MHGMLIGLTFVVGLALFALGLVVVTLPVLDGISLEPLWLASGAVSLIAGAALLWFVRRWANSQAAASSRAHVPFLAFVGFFNLLVLALSPHDPKWQGVILALCAIGAIVLAIRVVRILRRPGN